MNKKTEKILVGIGLGLLGAFGIYKFTKAYKKGMEELENQEFQETENLENAGVNTSELKNKINGEEKDFNLMLFNAVQESDIDLDLIDLHDDKMRGFIGGLTHIGNGKVIHVRQIIDTINKRGDTRRKLEFLVEIGDWFNDAYRGPKIGHFLTTLSKAAEHMSGNIVKFSDPARHKLVGYVVVSYVSPDNEDDVVVEYRKLVPEVFSQFAENGHDGLTKFYEIEKAKFGKTGPEAYIGECDWIYTNCPDLKEKSGVAVEDIVLMYSISFPIRSKNPGELFGIELKTAIECIKYLTEDVVIGREGGNKEYKYKHLIFHAPEPNTLNPSLVYYYDMDEETGNVIVSDKDVYFYDE